MKRKKRRGTKSERILATDGERTLLDLLDDVLNKGVLIDGEIVLGVADVDLIYLRLSTVLAAADRVLQELDLGEERQTTLAAGRHRPKKR